MKACDYIGEHAGIGCLLEKPDRRNPCCTHSKAFRTVLSVHASDRDHGDLDCAANLGELSDSLRRAKSPLGRCVENRAEEDVAGASTLRFARILEAMAGDADQELSRGIPAAAPPNHVARGHRFTAEMHPRRTGSESDIESVVYDDTDLSAPLIHNGPYNCCGDRLTRKLEKFASWHVLLADLDAIHSCTHGRTDCFQYTSSRFGWTERLPVRDIADNRFAKCV